MLTYNVFLERLTGTVGTATFDIHAWSGGGRGSRIHPSGDPSNLDPIQGWDYHTKLDEKKKIRGGYIPPGFWEVAKPTKRPSFKKLVAVLTPTLTAVLDENPPFGEAIATVPRDFWIKPFLIHEQGDKGSDGCIVISAADHSILMPALTEHGPVMLLVSDTLIGDFPEPDGLTRLA